MQVYLNLDLTNIKNWAIWNEEVKYLTFSRYLTFVWSKWLWRVAARFDIDMLILSTLSSLPSSLKYSSYILKSAVADIKTNLNRQKYQGHQGSFWKVLPVSPCTKNEKFLTRVIVNHILHTDTRPATSEKRGWITEFWGFSAWAAWHMLKPSLIPQTAHAPHPGSPPWNEPKQPCHWL